MAGPPRPPEVTIASAHRHVRHLVVPALIFVGSVGAASYWGGRLAPTWGTGWFGWAIVGAGVLVFAWSWLLWLCRRYTVTTRRLVIQEGVLVRHRLEVLHVQVRGCELVQSPIQRIVGSGEIRVNVGLENVVLVSDVPNAKLFFRALQELREAA